MANVNIKLPNGVVEERKVVTALEKYGNYVVALEKTPTPEMESNNIVVDVYTLVDGIYQPAPFDSPKWDEVKHALSDCIHANDVVEKDGVIQPKRVTNEEYRVLNGEIPVAMGKHPLSLREGNHTDILKNYELFLDSLNKKETVEAPAVAAEPTIMEIQPAAEVKTEENSMEVPQSVIPDVQNLSVPKEEQLSTDSVIQDIPVADTPIIVDSFANIPQPEIVTNTPAAGVIQDTNVIMEEKKIDEPVISVSTPEPVIQEAQSIIPETPVMNQTFAQEKTQDNNVVVDSYTNRAKDLEERLNRSVANLDAAVLAFKSDVQEIAKGLSELVKEGNAYHSLAGQAFDKVQEVQAMAMNNNNIVSFPSGMVEEQGPSLGKVA